MTERNDAPHQDRFYFIHVMKTAGATLATQLWKHFPAGRIYGYGTLETDFLTSTYLYVNPRPLAQLEPARVDDFVHFGGHFPYAARSLMGADVRTITLLRDPVERAISFLKHAQRYHEEHLGLPLEQIYDDEWYFTRFLDNHEVKMFSMNADEMLRHSSKDGFEARGWSRTEVALLQRWRQTPADLSDDERNEFHQLAVGEMGTARSIYQLLGAPNTAEVAVDERRLSDAIANLEQVDMVGIVERYDDFMTNLSRRLGIRLDSSARRNASDATIEVSPSLRSRIAEDLGARNALYDRACALAEASSV